MKKEKIQYILNKFGYELDEWTDLSDFSMILFSQDSNCFINPLRRYRFNSTTECLEIVNGKYDENGNFISLNNETNNFKNFAAHSFDVISGFLRSPKKSSGTRYESRNF